ncbi:MAG TPA: hypothetical protein VFB58_12390 [Chloroflexota bacterium]|nr:hypothetical protein [Chloroflexota bacterium]
MMAEVLTRFDCSHEQRFDVSIEDDVRIPDRARGLGKCPACRGGGQWFPVAGVVPDPDGHLTIDSIMIMPA